MNKYSFGFTRKILLTALASLLCNEATIANDMYVIIDWYSHHAENYRNQSTAFFQEVALTTLGHRLK